MDQTKPHKLRRLLLDIETSPNVVYSWDVGYDLRIDYDNIIEERAVICVAFKWHGDSKVQVFKWDKNHCDKKLLKSVYDVMVQADEIVGHNCDRFDMRWLRTRFLYHGLPAPPPIKTLDTFQVARSGLRFNSNRLDYIAGFLGEGRKIKTEFELWKQVMDGNEIALQEMIRYCKHDVVLLEKVYNRLDEYGAIKTHAGVLAGGFRSDCPKCASANTEKYGLRVTAAGTKQQRMRCRDCGRFYQISESALRRDEKTKGTIPSAKDKKAA